MQYQSTCVEIMYVKSVQKNLLLDGVSNHNETRRFRLRLISQEMSRGIWYARRKNTSRYGHSHKKYFFATDANLVRAPICDFRSVPIMLILLLLATLSM
jgi:hypothetical protein